MRPPSQKIFFVDDGTETRDYAFDILNGVGYEVTCFANASSCLAELERNGCHLLITDIKICDMDGAMLLNKAKHVAPWTPVLIISDSRDIPTAVQAMKLGAEDFIEKPINKTVFISKVREILSQNEFAFSNASLKLTKTEKKVLKLILDGCSNKEIALKMCCAVRTVEFHRSNLYHKFGVDNVVQLTEKAMAMFPSNNS